MVILWAAGCVLVEACARFRHKSRELTLHVAVSSVSFNFRGQELAMEAITKHFFPAGGDDGIATTIAGWKTSPDSYTAGSAAVREGKQARRSSTELRWPI